MNALDFGRPLGETTLKIYRTRWVGEAIFFTSGLQCISSVLADLWAKASYKFVGPSSQRFSNLPDNKPKLSVFSPKAKKTQNPRFWKIFLKARVCTCLRTCRTWPRTCRDNQNNQILEPDPYLAYT